MFKMNIRNFFHEYVHVRLVQFYEILVYFFDLSSVARKTGLIRYFMGHHLPKFAHKHDIITFGGVGRVSSWNRDGNANWQVL